ncbi:MAG: hypothetical protein JST12_01855 [Armatimonadetes bacterium]|nr:hypothetical protein [Armatimonadota bacterium]MBS1700381.1 hypothetical protein [Armatimonadota bacterium]
MPPQKPKTNGLVILFAVLGVLLICCGLPLGFLGYFGYKGFQGAVNMGGCFANAKLMSDALDSYVKAHDGKLPSAETWQSDISPYIKHSEKADKSPLKLWKANGEWSCEDGGEKTGFAFNVDASEKKVADLSKKDPNTVVIFETKTVAFNQSAAFKELPYSESPKILSGMIDERRGWILLNATGELMTRDKKGRLRNMGKNFNFDDSFDEGSGVKIKGGISSGSSDDGMNKDSDTGSSTNSSDDNSN